MVTIHGNTNPSGYKIIIINRQTEIIYKKTINVRKKRIEIRRAYRIRKENKIELQKRQPFFYFHCCISQLLESQKGSSYFLIQQRLHNKAFHYYV